MKKANGEGSIYQIKSGSHKGLYGASITLENGKRRYFYGKKRQDVYKKLQAALQEKQEGTLIETSQQTVAQYLQDWLEHSAKSGIRTKNAPKQANDHASRFCSGSASTAKSTTRNMETERRGCLGRARFRVFNAFRKVHPSKHIIRSLQSRVEKGGIA